jgi:hypothetical protein
MRALDLLRPEEDNQELTRRRATRRAGFGCVSGSPFCGELAASRGLGRAGCFRSASSLCEDRGSHRGRGIGSKTAGMAWIGAPI